MFNASIYSYTTTSTVQLTGDESHKQVVSIQGLAPVPATINTSVAAGIDGARYNSSRLEPRNIVILLHLTDPLTTRQALENALPTKGRVTFRYTTGTRAVEIDGYIDTWECDLFSMTQMVQISIICPDPYFRAQTQISKTLATSDETDLGATSNIDNGVTITATINGGYVSSLTFYNNEIRPAPFIKVSDSFQSGDIVTINTKRGQKSVTRTRSNVTTNIFSLVDPASTFFQVSSQHDNLSYAVNNSTTLNPTVSVVVTYHDLYAGV